MTGNVQKYRYSGNGFSTGGGGVKQKKWTKHIRPEHVAKTAAKNTGILYTSISE